MLKNILFLLLSIASLQAQAAVKLPIVITSGMVLQQAMPVPIWGEAAPGEKISVEFAGQKKETAADEHGHWRVNLDPMPACNESRTLVVTAATGEKQSLTDVFVGEVWLGSGQSNMDMVSWHFVKQDTELARLIDAGPYPELRLCDAGRGQVWQTATHRNALSFSAQLFAFGLALQKTLNVPIGLIQSAVGGTPSGYWLSQAAYAADPACQEVIAQYAKTYQYDAALKRYEADMIHWNKAVEDAKAKGEKTLPPEPLKPLRAGESRLPIGNLYESKIRPCIPFAIRGVLWDQGEHGTGIQGMDQYTLMGAFIRGWRQEWGQNFAFIFVQKPNGEGCAWDYDNPVNRLAEPFAPLPAEMTGNGVGRENQLRIRNYPNTYLSISSDLCSGIHPANKSGYGARAARVALGAVYQKPLEYYGPVYKSHTIEGNKVVVRFDHIGPGLAFRHGEKLQGFAVAGSNGKFQWADAEILGDTVVVSAAGVIKPVAVRYAWSYAYPWANLFNQDGLPALPFQVGDISAGKQ